jgi:cyanophycin synthetase
MHIFGSVTPDTSFAAAHASNNKLLTYELLENSSLPLLDQITIKNDALIEDAVRFMLTKNKVVVKPVDGSHGDGITMNVTNKANLLRAIKLARKATKQSKRIIVQEQYYHDTICDLRILIINHKYIGTIWRVPARVYGDGVHTVEELIDLENNSDDRGVAYRSKLTTIDVERTRSFLENRTGGIPAIGEEVQVMDVANYGAGGETIDVTDDIPGWLIDDAIKAVDACGLVVAGVDFMISQVPNPEMSRDDLRPAITEVNKAPLLTMHDTPTIGRGRRGATKAFMDYLATL